MVLLPDIMGVTGEFLWTGSAYGCDNDHITSRCSNIGPFFNHVINLCAVIAFYSLILLQMLTSRRRNNSDRSTYDKNLRSISTTLILLSGAYIAFLLPIAAFESCGPWGTTDNYQSRNVRAGIASWYWWIYGVNFIIYLLTSPRIRQAYYRFLSDIICHRGRALHFKSSDKLETFWAGSMDKGDGDHKLTNHHTLGKSIILTEVGRVNEMDNDDKTKNVATTHSSRGTEQLTAEEEVILLKRRLQELKLQLRGSQEDKAFKSASAN